MAYRIKSVAALTGLSSSTLRAWERRYGLLSPSRTASGYRLYTDEDVARLTRIKSLLDNGFKISEAISLLEREAPLLTPSDVSPQLLEEIRSELRETLFALDRSGANCVAERLAALTYERRLDEVLLPILREVGDCWARGDASIAQEHFVSAFIREKLIGMLHELDSGTSQGAEAVCAGVPGEAHEMGLLAAAIHLSLRGWRVIYLGLDLPYKELETVLAARRPALLCTSLMRPRSPQEYSEIAHRLDAIAPEPTLVVIGGRDISVPDHGELSPRLRLAQDIPALLGSLPEAR